MPAALVAHQLLAAVATSAGHRRPRNEDAHRIGPAVCVVADGMAGLADGAFAARIAVDVVSAHLAGPPVTRERIVDVVDLAIGRTPLDTVVGIDHDGAAPTSGTRRSTLR